MVSINSCSISSRGVCKNTKTAAIKLTQTNTAGYELTYRDSQFAMHFLKYAMQKRTKTSKSRYKQFLSIDHNLPIFFY